MATATRIGDPANRVDGVAKVTGRARYAAEHPAHDLLYGWVVSSSIAKGRIVAIHDDAAREVPGIVDVLTGAFIASVSAALGGRLRDEHP